MTCMGGLLVKSLCIQMGEEGYSSGDSQGRSSAMYQILELYSRKYIVPYKQSCFDK